MILVLMFSLCLVVYLFACFFDICVWFSFDLDWCYCCFGFNLVVLACGITLLDVVCRLTAGCLYCNFVYLLVVLIIFACTALMIGLYVLCLFALCWLLICCLYLVDDILIVDMLTYDITHSFTIR